MMLKENSG